MILFSDFFPGQGLKLWLWLWRVFFKQIAAAAHE